MISHAENFASSVRDELHKAARANGIDTSMVGFTVSSTFGPVQVGPNQQSLMPGWLLVVSLRVELIGTPPVVIPMMIPYTMHVSGTMHLPADDDFRGAARQAFDVAMQARDRLLHPDAVPGAVPGLVVG